MAELSDANLDAAGGAHLANRLRGVADEVEKHLDALVGVADEGGEPRGLAKVDFDGIALQGMLVEVESALDDGVEGKGFFLRGGGAGGRENSRRFWTMRGARRAWRWVMSSWRLVFSSTPARSRRSSLAPRM